MRESSSDSLVTLGVDNSIFGISVENVLEILDARPITILPHAPIYLLGMIDVRGITVPVVDLRVKLGLPHQESDDGLSRILVLDIPGPERRLRLGLQVDEVYEVAELDGGLIESPPEIGVPWHSDYIRGIGRRGNAFVVIFDLARLFSQEEAAFLSSTVQDPE